MSLRRFIAFALLVASISIAPAAEPARTPPGASAEGEYPFAKVIRETTGHRVIAFDKDNPQHAALLEQLKKVALEAARSARANRITSNRANEAGNAMENHVLRALTAAGFKAHRPRTQSGHKQSAGYPDIAIETEPFCYLELKTFSPRTQDSSQRTFYYSPSPDTKITRDALHLLLAFEMKQLHEGNRSIWLPVRFKIVSLHNLRVRLKVEYNQNNRGLYSPERILADETID